MGALKGKKASQWRDGGLGRPHCLPGTADLRQLRHNFTLVLGGYILLEKSIRENMVDHHKP